MAAVVRHRLAVGGETAVVVGVVDLVGGELLVWRRGSDGVWLSWRRRRRGGGRHGRRCEIATSDASASRCECDAERLVALAVAAVGVAAMER